MYCPVLYCPFQVTREEKGPIFEDGPNFNMAFRLFHGQNGVVPLSERPFNRNEKHPSESPSSQFNPLAARAATISLSSFGHGGPFGFDAFSEMWKNSKKKSSSSKKDSSSKVIGYVYKLNIRCRNSVFRSCFLEGISFSLDHIFTSHSFFLSQKGKSQHEATSNEWLQTGNCPISKSYRAVNKVLPLVAKALQPPPGIHLKCPPAIIAARAAISKTAFAKNLRPQPLPAKVLVIGILGMAANIPLGIWREHTKKFSPSWFVAVHAAVPFIGMLRKSVLMPKSAMAFTIAASILGQVIGSRAERYRLKTAENGSSLAGAAQAAAAGVRAGGCSEVAVWKPDSLQLTSSSAVVG